MDPFNTVFRPPTLDGKNYTYWKVKTRAYIKAIDERAWRAVTLGWTPPKVVDEDGDYIIKPEEDWSYEETQLATFNNKVINTIYGAVDLSYFKMISNCVAAKDAWEILQRYYEGIPSVRRTKLRMIANKFANLRMADDETIESYNLTLCDIANQAQALGDPINNERLVSKAMRSLPERFNIKISAIEEAKDTTSLRLDELMGILQTFEMNLA